MSKETVSQKWDRVEAEIENIRRDQRTKIAVARAIAFEEAAALCDRFHERGMTCAEAAGALHNAAIAAAK